MATNTKIPELLKIGHIDALKRLSQNINSAFAVSRKKRYGLLHSANVSIYTTHVNSITKNIQNLLELNKILASDGIENPQETIEKITKEIQESMIVLAKTTKDPSKQKILLENMNDVMNAISYAQSELVRAPLRMQFSMVEKQTKKDYKQGKNEYYDDYVRENWVKYSANYEERLAKYVEEKYEAALAKEVESRIEKNNLQLERVFQNQYLPGFIEAKERELMSQGKSFKNLTDAERLAINEEFNQLFKNWVGPQLLNKDWVKQQVLNEGFQEKQMNTLNTTFKKEFDIKFQDQYVEHCKDQITHFGNEIGVRINPNDDKLKLNHMKAVIVCIEQTCTGKTEEDKIARNTCIGILESIKKLEEHITKLTSKGGMTPEEAGKASLGINMLPQLFATLLKCCEDPKAKAIMALKFPALYQQLQGINLDIQTAQMQCEMHALEKMQDNISNKGKSSEYGVLSDTLAGEPIVVAPGVVSSSTIGGTTSNIKTQLHTQVEKTRVNTEVLDSTGPSVGSNKY